MNAHDEWISTPGVEIQIYLIKFTIDGLMNSPWKEKKEHLDSFNNQLQPTYKIHLNYTIQLDDFINAMIKIISTDVTIAVVLCAARAIENIAFAARVNYPASKVVPTLTALLGRTREKKPSIIDTLMSAAKAICKFCNPSFSMLVDACCPFIGNKVPAVKISLLNLLSSCIPSIPTIGKSDLNVLLSYAEPSLISLTSDSSGEVRDAASELFGILLCRMPNIPILHKTIDQIGDKLKIAKIHSFLNGKAVVEEKPSSIAIKELDVKPTNKLNVSAKKPGVPQAEQKRLPTTQSESKRPIEQKKSQSLNKPSLPSGGLERYIALMTNSETYMSDATARETLYGICPRLTTISSSMPWKERFSIIEESKELLTNQYIYLDPLSVLVSSLIQAESVNVVSLALLALIRGAIQGMTHENNEETVCRSIGSLLSILFKALGDPKLTQPYSSLLLELEGVWASDLWISEAFLCALVVKSTEANKPGSNSSIKNPKGMVALFSICNQLVPRICARQKALHSNTLELIKNWLSLFIGAPQPVLRNLANLFAISLLSHSSLIPIGLAAGSTLLGLTKPPTQDSLTNCDHPCSSGISGATPVPPLDQNSDDNTSHSNSACAIIDQPDASSITNTNVHLELDGEKLSRLNSSVWKERKTAIDYLAVQLSTKGLFFIKEKNFIELVENLSKRFQDTNGNIVTQALELFLILLKKASSGMVKKQDEQETSIQYDQMFARALPALISSLIGSLSDTKACNRNAAKLGLSALLEFVPAKNRSALVNEALLKTEACPSNALLKRESLLWLQDIASNDVVIGRFLIGSKALLGTLLPGAFQDKTPECRQAAHALMERLVVLTSVDNFKKSIERVAPKSSAILFPVLAGLTTPFNNTTFIIDRSSEGCTTTMDRPKEALLGIDQQEETHQQVAILDSIVNIVESKTKDNYSHEEPNEDHFSKWLDNQYLSGTEMALKLPSPPFKSDLSDSFTLYWLVRTTKEAPVITARNRLTSSPRLVDSIEEQTLVLIARLAAGNLSPQQPPFDGFWTQAADALNNIGLFHPTWIRSLLLSGDHRALQAVEQLRQYASKDIASKVEQYIEALFAIYVESLVVALILSVLSIGSIGVAFPQPAQRQDGSVAHLLAMIDTIELLIGKLESHQGRLEAKEASLLIYFFVALACLDERDAVRHRAKQLLSVELLRVYPASRILFPLLFVLCEQVLLVSEGKPEEGINQQMQLVSAIAASVRARAELVDICAAILRATSLMNEESFRIISLGARALAFSESDPLVRRSIIGMLSSLTPTISIEQLCNAFEQEMSRILGKGFEGAVGGQMELEQLVERLTAASRRLRTPLLSPTKVSSPKTTLKRPVSVGTSPMSATLRQRKREFLDIEPKAIFSNRKSDEGGDSVQLLDPNPSPLGPSDEEELPASLADLSMESIDPVVLQAIKAPLDEDVKLDDVQIYRARLSQYTNTFTKIMGETVTSVALFPDNTQCKLGAGLPPAEDTLNSQILAIKERLARIKDGV